MKKTLSSILMAALCLGLVACGDTPGSSTVDPSGEGTTTTAVGFTTTGESGTTVGVPDTTTAAETDATAAPTTAAGTTGVATTGNTTGGKTTMPTTASTKADYSQYDLNTYMQPIWEGDTVYHETVMFVPDPVTKKVQPAPLLYTPDKVLSVRSYDLKTEYKEGIDYKVENGCIRLTMSSRIPQWKYDDYFRKTADVYDLPSISAPGRHLKYGGADMAKMQVCVTYTHKDTWQGPKPTYQGDKLPKTMELFRQKKPVTIVYNGDSVMEGCDASSKLNIAPYMPIWPIMVSEVPEKTYGSKINYINTAVGGTTSDWGQKEVENNIISRNPDLVVLRFGTNDGTSKLDSATYQANHRASLWASSSGTHRMISSTLQFRIWQNISMVWVLTLSLRLSRVICIPIRPAHRAGAAEMHRQRGRHLRSAVH